MPFLLLLLFALVTLQKRWPEPLLGWPTWAMALLTWGSVALLLAWADWLTRRTHRRLERDPEKRSTLLRHFNRRRRYYGWALVALFVASLYLGWGWTAQGVFDSWLWFLPGLELVLLAPFFTCLLLSWVRFYDVERLAHQLVAYPESTPYMTRAAYFALQARHQLLLVVPPLLLMMVQQIIYRGFPELEGNAYFAPLFAASLLVFAFIAIPLLLRVFLGLESLPDGPLRQRLMATARRLNFRFNDILLWNTRGTVGNAMVTGFVPFLRYVIVTDKLIQELTEDEVEAVFGHEVGHIKHHHMAFYVGFLLASLMLLTAAWTLAWQRLFMPFLPAVLDTVIFLVLLSAYIYVVFGFLSRRCERQADIFGCRTVSTPVFISALERVAVLNGIHRERPGWMSSWQHSTIARRVAFLQSMHEDPAVGPRFQRRVGALKWGVVLALSLSLTLIFSVLGPAATFEQVLGVNSEPTAETER